MKTRTAEWFFRIFMALVVIITLGFSLCGCGGEKVTVVDQPPVVPPSVVIPPQDMIGGSVVFTENRHAITFDLSDNTVKGVVSDNVITPDMVKSVNFNSDRTGWLEGSVAVADFDPSGHILLPNTANNDIGTWTLLLKTGKYVWFNTEKWEHDPTIKFEIMSDGLVQYGNYKPTTIRFTVPDNVGMDFGCNKISGFVSTINPTDIAFIRWNSNETGWSPNGSVQGALEVDSRGNYFVKITGMPLTSKGNFTAHLKDGTTVVWMNVTTWNIVGNNTVDLVAGQIEYRM